MKTLMTLMLVASAAFAQEGRAVNGNEWIDVPAEGGAFRVAVPEAGYVRFKAEAGAPPRVEFLLDGATKAYAEGAARVNEGTVLARVGKAAAAGQGMFEFFPENDLLEPNNRPEDATPIDCGASYTVSLMPPGDPDWFRLHADGPGFFRVEMLRAPSFPVRWDFRDAAGKLVEAALVPAAAGETLVRLMPAGNAGSPEEVEFRISFVEEQDELEPNDAAPVAVVAGREYGVSLVRPGDVDKFEIEVTRHAFLSIRTRVEPSERPVLKATQKGKDAPMWRKNPATREFVERPLGGAQLVAEKNLWCELQPGKAEISLRATLKHSVAPFTIEFIVQEDPEEPAPNDTREQATPIALGEGKDVMIWGSRDQDWFRVEVPAEGLLSTQMSGTVVSKGGQNVAWEMFDEKGKILPFLKLNNIEYKTVRPVKPGTYYVCVVSQAAICACTLTVDLATEETLDLKSIPSGGLATAFIALDVDPATLASLRILSKTSGGSFTNSGSAAAIAEGMRKALVETKIVPVQPPVVPVPAVVIPTPVAAEKTAVGLLFWLVPGGALLLIVLGAVAFRLRKRPAA